MARIKLSQKAAQDAIKYSEEARDQLMMNINVMDNNVNSQFSGLKDPAFRRYLELSGQMQDLLKQISGKMDEVSEYCQKMIAFIKAYSET